MSVALLLVVTLFGLFLAKSRGITAFDLGVDRALSRMHVSSATDLALGIYRLFSPPEAIALTVVFALIVLAVSRHWRSALTFSVVVGVSWLSSDVVKMLVSRPRPAASALAHPFLPTPTDASFPSGHVVFVASMAFAFSFLARDVSRRAIVVVLGAVATMFTAFAVSYLGVHYPTDVAAAILWACGACPLTLALWNRFVIPRWERPAPAAIDA